MSVNKVSSIYRGEKTLGAKIVLNQIDGTIDYYESHGDLCYKIGVDSTGYIMRHTGYLGTSVIFGGSLGSFQVNAGYAEVGSIHLIASSGGAICTDGNYIGIRIKSDSAMGDSYFELNDTLGVRIPRTNGIPSSTSTGYLWFNVTANKIQYIDDAGATKTITAT
jgi:hypothetical protein